MRTKLFCVRRRAREIQAILKTRTRTKTIKDNVMFLWRLLFFIERTVVWGKAPGLKKPHLNEMVWRSPSRLENKNRLAIIEHERRQYKTYFICYWHFLCFIERVVGGGALGLNRNTCEQSCLASAGVSGKYKPSARCEH